MKKNSAGISAAIVVLISLIVIGGATAALVLTTSPASSATSNSSTVLSPLDSAQQSTGNSLTSSTSCNQPPYLTKLASQVEQTQNFNQRSHGLSYVLAYGSNDSAATGTANGKPLYYPPETELVLYSYGTISTAVCPADLGTNGVVGALWIQVPIDANGSYDLANMSIYLTPGVFSNSTSTAQID